jgi:hypothetical protein
MEEPVASWVRIFMQATTTSAYCTAYSIQGWRMTCWEIDDRSNLMLKRSLGWPHSASFIRIHVLLILVVPCGRRQGASALLKVDDEANGKTHTMISCEGGVVAKVYHDR